MARFIEFNSKRSRKLIFNISPSTEFQRILSQMNAVRFTDCGLSNEQVIYAVLELINNSLRAHREKAVEHPIVLRMSAKDDGFEIYLQDWGGGFDISRLPYDLNENVDSININDDNFEEYRELHDQKRFGLGLYLAKKTFSIFSLYFIDEHGRKTTWENGQTAGTVIYLKTRDISADEELEELYEEPAHI